MTNQPLTAEAKHYSPVITIPAHIISYIFHPLFIPAYITAFLVYIHPYAFAGLPDNLKLLRVLLVFFNTGFIPAFSVFLMWRLRLIQSMYLKTQKERIIPYAASMIFYFWAWYVVRKMPDNPDYFISFMMGSFLSVCASWFLNIYAKVSMHATAMGGMVLFFLLRAFAEYEITGLYFSVAILMAGLVCTSRLLVSSHSAREIYIGFFAGALCQLIALALYS